MANIINLFLGGVIGTFSRYYLSSATYRVMGSDFPYGTLIVNLIGCFLIGLFAVLSEEKFVINGEGRLLLMVGFCGAFTTFSTLILESANLIKYGEVMKAFVNIGGSVILGFLAFWAGNIFARIF
jgi:fluoride exporter